MGITSNSNAASLLMHARRGCLESLGELLELYRNYLQLLARTQIDLHLNGRASTSDLVQETMLEACRDFGGFRGTTERELLAWLRRVLVHNIARFVERNVLAKKRDVRREVSFERTVARLEGSAIAVNAALNDRWKSPSARLHSRERAAIVADLLAHLPAQYREVIVLRDLEGLAFAEVGRRMGRSPAAVRKLWLRALDRLRQRLHKERML